MRRSILRGLGRVAGRVPALLVWAGLAGLFVYGHRVGWKFTADEKKAEEKHDHGDEPEAGGPFTPYSLPQPGDVPVVVTHDPAACKLRSKAIKLKSAEAAARAGIKAAPVEYGVVSVTVEAHGEVVQDPVAAGRATARLGGTVVSLEKAPGDTVRRGELLAVLDAPEVGRAKAAYLVARALLESRELDLASVSAGGSTQRTVEQARAAAREARANLYAARQGIANLGLPVPSADDEKLSDDAIAARLQLIGLPQPARVAAQTRAEAAGLPVSANLIPVVSPLDGVVTRRAAVVGETVGALHPVYEVADPGRVDVYLDVRQEDVPRVKPGQAVTFRVEGGPDAPEVEGRIDWLGPAVDEKTRTLRVRVRVPNPTGELKPGAFGAGTVWVEDPFVAVVVPAAAVQWEGCSHVVFLKLTDKVYQARPVTLGARDGDVIEVLSGVEPGDEIVMTGSHVLKCELLKDRIGDAEE